MGYEMYELWLMRQNRGEGQRQGPLQLNTLCSSRHCNGNRVTLGTK